MKTVIKIGSNLLASPDSGLNVRRVRMIVTQIAEVLNGGGGEVVIVSSGAVAAGLRRMGLKRRPADIALRQAAAAVGQSRLIWAYARSFRDFGLRVAQVLLTAEDIKNRARYLNARTTLQTLLGRGIVPIVNENDVVSTDEIRFGDNDNLAALVASMLGADLLLILSDVDGLFDADPGRTKHARLIPVVESVTPEILGMAGCEGGSCIGTGGMYSKLLAAKTAGSHGITVQIVSGKRKNIVARALRGDPVGTRFPASARRISSRKRWIAQGARIRGTITVDEGAARALRKKGRSLLPAGISAVEGTFKKGDAVIIAGPDGIALARGLTNYPAGDASRIMGKKAAQIEGILGYKYADEVVHRDNLVLLEDH